MLNYFKNESGLIGFDQVFTAELEAINARRNGHNTQPDQTLSRFQQLERGIATPPESTESGFGIEPFPAGERTNAFNNVLDQLQDTEQNDRWERHGRETGQPARQDLVGLAFSGGGIRSATFNLGILQALARVRLFKFVDYLSTVSGGGYLGSCLSSLYASPTREFPFPHKQGEVESPAFRHLRNNAEYLAPNGLFDTLRIPMLLLRGLFINLLVVLPYIVAAALVTAMLNADLAALKMHLLRRFFVLNNWPLPDWLGTHFLLLKISFVALLGIFFLYPIGYLLFQRSRFWLFDFTWPSRDRVGRCLSWAAVILGLLAFVEIQPVAILYMAKLAEAARDTGDIVTFYHQVATVLTGLTVLPAFLAHWAGKQAARLSTDAVLTLIGVCGIAVFWLLYLFLSYYFIDGQLGGNWCIWLSVLALWSYTVIFIDINFTSLHGFYRDRLSRAYLVKFAGKSGASVDKTTLKHDDEQLLSTLNTADGPYHLINAAINLRELDEDYKKGRHAQAFLFSKCFIGSEATGYRPTGVMESQSRNVNLGTAMAISGAAASPQMGRNTNRMLAFVLAMANVRLNHWLPNPRYAQDRTGAKLPRSPLTRVGPLYLLREMIGNLNARGLNVNLSDGGHFENLGLYELLRRECRFIICGDGEADPTLTFDGLANAIRMAQIDFGIKVAMEGLDEIRAGEQNHAIGKIHYSGGLIGWLLYLKLSLLGDNNLISTLNESAYETSPRRDDNRRFDDNAYIAQYKSRHPDFPHQSTADQFFDEQQFEAYRALGFLVGMRALTR
ncbi:MAG: hypothetical protein EPO31_06465 [Gammaproteobacteria bacterium]|nr:MAG: hypothetical protein EPO31_06465 [Gammaproteobacteria bacterium]